MKQAHRMRRRERLAEGEQQPSVKSGTLRQKGETNSTDETKALLEYRAEHMKRPNAGIAL
jgi:hypothetical protein